MTSSTRPGTPRTQSYANESRPLPASSSPPSSSSKQRTDSAPYNPLSQVYPDSFWDSNRIALTTDHTFVTLPRLPDESTPVIKRDAARKLKQTIEAQLPQSSTTQMANVSKNLDRLNMRLPDRRQIEIDGGDHAHEASSLALRGAARTLSEIGFAKRMDRAYATGFDGARAPATESHPDPRFRRARTQLTWATETVAQIQSEDPSLALAQARTAATLTRIHEEIDAANELGIGVAPALRLAVRAAVKRTIIDEKRDAAELRARRTEVAPLGMELGAEYLGSRDARWTNYNDERTASLYDRGNQVPTPLPGPHSYYEMPAPFARDGERLELSWQSRTAVSGPVQQIFNTLDTRIQQAHANATRAQEVDLRLR